MPPVRTLGDGEMHMKPTGLTVLSLLYEARASERMYLEEIRLC